MFPLPRRCQIKTSYLEMKILSSISVVLLLTTFPVVAQAGDEPERLKFADGLYARQMYELAVKEYEGVLKDFPESLSIDVVRFRLGESYRSLEKFADADRIFRDLYMKNAGSQYRFKAGFRRAELHKLSGKTDNAITLYKLLLEDKAPPDIASASLYYLGEIYQGVDNKADAVSTFEKLCSEYKQSEFYAYALLKLGDIYYRGGLSGDDKQERVRKAIAAYSSAAQYGHDARTKAEAVFQIAEIYYRQKDYKQSAEFYGRLIKTYPDDKRTAEAGLQAAWSEYYIGLYADAMKLADSAISVKTGDLAEWLYLKANSERQLMKNNEAVETYALLLKDYPGSNYASSARYEKALASFRAGDYKAAVSEAGAIIIPSDGSDHAKALQKDVYWLLAECYAALDNVDQAVQYYRLIVREFPESDVASDSAYRLAYHLQNKGEYLEASRNYSLVARKFPDGKLAAKSLFASGVCLAKEKKFEEAIRDWSDLVRGYPGDPLVEESLYQKGMNEIRLNRNDTALDSLEQLVMKYPQTGFCADAYYWRGVLLKEAGRLQDAEGSFQKSLQSSPREDLARDAEFNLALVLHKLGKTDESADLFQKLISTPVASKFSPELLEWLAGYRYAKKDYDASINSARLLVDSFKDPAWKQIGAIFLGRCSMAKGDAAGAGEMFEKAVNMDVVTPYTAEAALRLGEISLSDGKNEIAIQSFEKAAKLAVNDDAAAIRANAYAGLARASEMKGNLEVAARYFMSVAILYDEEQLVSECLYRAVCIFRKLGRVEDASKTEVELKKRYPGSRFVKVLDGSATKG